MSSAAPQKGSKSASKSASTMTMVLPGNETGVYFIALGNLPFHSTWQELKDFIRAVVDVEHVAIFPKSTSGWVKIKGHDNFLTAYNFLNGAHFQGRALQADGRNEFESIPIRDLHLAGETVKVPPQTAAGGAQTNMYTSSAYGGQTAASIVAIGSNRGYTSTCNTSQGTQGYVTNPTPYYGTNTQSYYNATNAALPPYDTSLTSPTTASYASYGTYGSSQAYPVSNPSYNYSLQQPSYQTTPAVPPAGRYLDTEQRKVIIKNLAWSVKEDQVTKLIRETSGSDWDKIQDINTQRDKKGNIKYVFVLFKTTGSALRLESKLNNRDFKGRPLAVKLAQEGATAAETTAQPGQKPSGKRSKNRNKDKDKDKSLEKKVVIADGSSTRKPA